MRIDDRKRHETLNKRINMKGNKYGTPWAYGNAKGRDSEGSAQDRNILTSGLNPSGLNAEGLYDRYGRDIPSRKEARKRNIKFGTPADPRIAEAIEDEMARADEDMTMPPNYKRIYLKELRESLDEAKENGMDLDRFGELHRDRIGFTNPFDPRERPYSDAAVAMYRIYRKLKGEK